MDGQPVERATADADVAWITADLFDEGAPLRPYFGGLLRLPSLRWAQSPAAGTDAPIWGQLLDRGVRVSNAHIGDVSISEYVLRAALDHFQQAGAWRSAQADTAWRRHDFREIAHTTWLVIGLGAIGSAVAVRAGAFGARVIGSRRHPSGQEPVERVIRPDEVLSTVPDADVVVLSAPGTNETQHLVDAQFLAAMRPGSVLINIARGSLVDEEALLVALDRGIPEAAVLDVTDQEPLPADSRLWTHPRVTITPHNSAGGVGRYAAAADLFCDNLGRYLADQPLRNELTASALD